MKKSTKIISAVLASLMLVAAGCGSDKPAEKKAGGPEEKVLTVYSARSEQLNNAVIPQFEKDTGIKVNLVVAGTGEVLKRAKSEKDNPLGDILWAADETMLSSSKDLFMEYTSTENDKMMDGFKNKAGVFTPAFADPTVMIVNTELANGMKIDSFEDLLNPALKGKIAFGDPVNSSSAFQSLMAMLYGMGKTATRCLRKRGIMLINLSLIWAVKCAIAPVRSTKALPAANMSLVLPGKTRQPIL